MPQEQGEKQQDSGVAQGTAVGAGGTVAVGGIVAALLLPQYRKPILILLVLIVLAVVVGLAVFLVWRSRHRKRKAEQLGQDVGSEFDNQAARSNDTEVKVRLEKMKRKFLRLIETLRGQGHKDIYQIPWFLTLGPSGSGKSWVLKGGGMEPLGDEDWKKGTLLIDWWTSEDAVVLDTAGGVAFKEEKGYDSPEWQSLLGLLKRHRPQCPINGLLVMVPAQLLWLRDDELPEGWLSLEDYANALRRQIRKKLQGDLGIRFPVYFVVTQCDRVPGFREFADNLEANRHSKSQMLGWSLPVEVGKKTLKSGSSNGGDPELAEVKIIDQRLREVAGKLRRQRLALLHGYVGNGARADQVSMDVRKRAADLFSFPDAIQSTLSPRLKELLTKVFKPDPTLPPMPPYLRGVYFTSSLREGEVLNRHSIGIGRSLQDLALPGGADNTQPNSFFQKDLIFGKAFPEWGLVTPLVEARAWLQQRRRTLVFAGIGATSLLLVAIGIGGCSYSSTVGRQITQWRSASDGVRTNNNWLPVVSGPFSNVQLDTNNIQNQISLAKAVGAQETNRSSFRQLFSMRKLDNDRRLAQMHLFERGVLKPMADLAREKIIASSHEPAKFDEKQLPIEQQQFEAGLLAILELDLCSVNRTWQSGDWEASRDRVLDGLGTCLLSGQKNGSSAVLAFKDLCNQAYSKRQGSWPPQSTKQFETLSNLLEAAFARISQLQSNQSGLFGDRRTRLRDEVREAGDIKELEETLLGKIENRDPAKNLAGDLEEVRNRWGKLAEKLHQDHVETFLQAFTNFAVSVRNDAEARQKGLRERITHVNGAGIPGTTNLISPLARGFDTLTGDVPRIENVLEGFKDLKEPAAILDVTMLEPYQSTGKNGQRLGNPQPIEALRLALYGQVIELDLQALSTRLRKWARDVFEDSNDSADTIANINKEAVEKCNSLQTHSLDALTNGTIPGPEIIRQYVEYRYLERFLELGTNMTAEVLGAGDCSVELRNTQQPRQMLVGVGNAWTRLGKLDRAWKDLERRWRELGNRREARPIKAATTLIGEKRDSLQKQVFDQIDKECKTIPGSNRPAGPPLAAQGDLLTDEEVLKFRERAKLWKEALQNPPKEAKDVPTDVRNDYWEKRVDDRLLLPCQRLVDDKTGEILEYDLSTPWGKDYDAFQKFLRNDAEFRKAKEAAARYRSWTIDGKYLQADKPDDTLPVNAARGFSIQAKRSEADAPETIKTLVRKEGWTIIAMLDLNRQSRQPPFFVPIEIATGPQTSESVWFVIRPRPAR